MTGEKDPRDVMQAEHDARLSEHPAFRAPAEMPGEREVARAIASFRKHLYPDTKIDILPSELAQAAAVMALFEREAFRRETRALAQAQAWRNEAAKLEARALAAEAALAAERERTTVAMARLKEYASDPDIALTLQGSPDKCEALQDAIAAAIRAQANNEPGA